MIRDAWLILAVNAALTAGKEILEVYNSSFSVKEKEDNSPITEADKKAHSVILKALETTGVPILSEEGIIPSYKERKNWKRFWVVDPLDGTKEFVKRNGEFTVNIALIENGKPSMGIIYIPLTQQLYFSDKQSYKIENIDSSAIIKQDLLNKALRLPLPQKRKNYIILGSRSHMNDETTTFINKQKETYTDVEIISKGSSLKLCLIAEGNADIYPRLSPTMEWDTAAGHAIVNAAGGQVLNWDTKTSLEYNKENLLNPSFLVSR